MKKKKWQLLLMLALLIICIGGYLGIQAYNKSSAEKKEAAAEADKENLSNLGKIISFKFRNSGGEFAFELEGDRWRYLPDKDFPLDQNKFQSIISTIRFLKAVRTFEPSESLSSYGLENPACGFTATDVDGKSLTMLIGTSTNNDYYAMKQNDTLVHTVSSLLVTYLNYTLNDLAELETFPSLKEETIASIQIISGNKTLKLEKETVNTGQEAGETGKGEGGTGENKPEYTWYLNKDGSRTAADDLSVASILNQLGSLAFEGCENYKTKQQAFSDYGLDRPSITLTVTYNLAEDGKAASESYKLSIGSLNKEGNAYYAVKDSSVMVHRNQRPNRIRFPRCPQSLSLNYQSRKRIISELFQIIYNDTAIKRCHLLCAEAASANMLYSENSADLIANLPNIIYNHFYEFNKENGGIEMGKALIIGAGGVANVVAHKCCQAPEVFEEICLASRTLKKCQDIRIN
jgi:hypothetical protein